MNVPPRSRARNGRRSCPSFECGGEREREEKGRRVEEFALANKKEQRSDGKRPAERAKKLDLEAFLKELGPAVRLIPLNREEKSLARWKREREKGEMETTRET